MTTDPTTATSRRRSAQGEKRIPEYLEVDEVNATIKAAPSPKANLLTLQQWRAGLRVFEALDLEVRDLSLDTATPTLRVRSSKGGKPRLAALASGTAWRSEQRTCLRGDQSGQNHRGVPCDRMALGASCCEVS